MHLHETPPGQGGLDIGHLLLHSLTDVAKMLPFLFLAYLLIEYLERHQSERMERMLGRGGRWGFVVGAVLGLVPQCGFSAMAAGLYSSRVITLGTLLAVFLATSDEAIPIMLARPDSYGALLLLLLFKLAFALLVGFVVDVLLRRAIPQRLRGGFDGGAQAVDCHHHDAKDNIWLATAKHTANIFLVVFAFTFLFGLLVELVGEAALGGILAGLGPLQPVVAGLVGLIPNCASSVLLTQLYLAGGISFGSVLAGLCVNAGVGLLVLLRTNRPMWQNFFVLGLLYLLGVGFGLAVHLLGPGL